MHCFGHFVSVWALQRPNAVAIHFQGVDYSYAWLERQIQAAMRWLPTVGVKHGDRVAYLGLNHPMILIILFALARRGAILVPLNFRLTHHELEQQLKDAQTALLIVDQHFVANADALHHNLFDVATLAEQFEQARPTAPQASVIGTLDDDLLLVYTSGTTGHPKGAVLTQNALLWNAINSVHAHDLSSRDRVLIVLPMFHVGGLNIMLTPALYVGATVALQAKFDASEFLRVVQTWRPTLSLLVPATIRAVLGSPLWPTADLSSLRLINTGSSIVPRALLEAWHACGIPAAQVYGATETAPIAIYLREEDTARKLGSAGQAALHCEVRLVNAAGTNCAVDEVGEIYIRGPNVMRGYWRMPEATNQTFDGDWFKTGDLAYRDTEGYFWIVGRSKDLIISGGENIYPAEIETLIAEHPAVAECAVVGITNSQWGEVPVLVLVLRQPLSQSAGSYSLNDVMTEMLDQKLAKFKWPKHVLSVESLPKTALGKVQKDVLREQIKNTEI